LDSHEIKFPDLWSAKVFGFIEWHRQYALEEISDEYAGQLEQEREREILGKEIKTALEKGEISLQDADRLRGEKEQELFDKAVKKSHEQAHDR
jgi:hypothetical protein